MRRKLNKKKKKNSKLEFQLTHFHIPLSVSRFVSLSHKHSYKAQQSLAEKWKCEREKNDK